MAEFIYTMTKARKAHGDKVILDDVTMSFYPGAKIGVVGPNGAGKSTILKIMAGLDQPSNGEARLSPGYSVGILMQEPTLNEEKTVLGNVEEGLGQIKADVDRFNAISIEMAEPGADFETLMEEMGQLQEKIDAADAWDLDSQLEQAMDALRCPPPDADVSVLSGGERRRVALCKLLLQKPDLLLLDEPTNHLDAESVLWLEQHLASYHGAVLAVTHDRYFLDNVAQWIAEIDRGRLYPYEGNYSTYLQKKSERLTVQGKKDAKLAKRLVAELEWVRSNAKARQVKSKARLSRYEEMAAEADRTRKLDFEEIQVPPEVELAGAVGLGGHLLVPGQPRLGLHGPRLGVGPDPLELGDQALGELGVLLALHGKALTLLLQVGRVVALVRIEAATVDLGDPLGDVIEEVAVVGHCQHGAVVGSQVLLKPEHALGVEVVGGLVEQQQVGLLQQQLA